MLLTNFQFEGIAFCRFEPISSDHCECFITHNCSNLHDVIPKIIIKQMKSNIFFLFFSEIHFFLREMSVPKSYFVEFS